MTTDAKLMPGIRREMINRSTLCPCHDVPHSYCPDAEPCIGKCGRLTTAHESSACGYCLACSADPSWVTVVPGGPMSATEETLPAIIARVRGDDWPLASAEAVRLLGYARRLADHDAITDAHTSALAQQIAARDAEVERLRMHADRFRTIIMSGRSSTAKVDAINEYDTDPILN